MQVIEQCQQQATLQILYSEVPEQPGDCFVEIRQWQTAGADNMELVVEYGTLDEGCELQTRCQVMPYFMTVQEVLTALEF